MAFQNITRLKFESRFLGSKIDLSTKMTRIFKAHNKLDSIRSDSKL